MEYDDYIKYFKDNSSFFETTVKDFKYLASIKPGDYTNENNLKRLVPILSEISFYSVLYGNQDITFYIGYYGIEDEERFYKVSEVSEMCYKFFAMLVDSKCEHPIVVMYDSLKNAANEYETVFDTIGQMATSARNDGMDEFAYAYDSAINDDIFKEEADSLEMVSKIYKCLSDRDLINLLSQIFYKENYKKVCQLESVELGDYSYCTVEKINKNNPLLIKIEGKKPIRITDIMAACVVSSKPIYMMTMMAQLEEIKEKYGDIILDDDYIDEDEYDDDLSDDAKDISDIDLEYYDYNYCVNNGLTSIKGNEENIETNIEEPSTIETFVNNIKNSYTLYKKYQFDFMKSSEVTAKILTKRQDM